MQTNYGDSTFEDRVLTICSGRDYVNINYHHVVCPDSKIAEVSGFLDTIVDEKWLQECGFL